MKLTLSGILKSVFKWGLVCKTYVTRGLFGIRNVTKYGLGVVSLTPN